MLVFLVSQSRSLTIEYPVDQCGTVTGSQNDVQTAAGVIGAAIRMLQCRDLRGIVGATKARGHSQKPLQTHQVDGTGYGQEERVAEAEDNGNRLEDIYEIAISIERQLNYSGTD